MELFCTFFSPNCRKPRAVINYLDLDVKVTTLDYSKGEFKTPEFLAINPNGFVPALVDGDLRLWESNAIMQYLAATAPHNGSISGLYPHEPLDTQARADVDRWLFWETAHYNMALTHIIVENYINPHYDIAPRDDYKADYGLARFHKCAPVLEAQLEGHPYVTGANPTIADFALGCWGAFLEVGGAPLDGYPNIAAWYERLDTLPAWRESAPPQI